MLSALTIRNVALIEELELEFDAGLCVLTGETGAGKSILLDALTMALGARGDATLVGPAKDRAEVSAEFETAGRDDVQQLLIEAGHEPATDLVLRRTIGRDGRSRAFVNDQPVSIGLLRQLGETLVELHGQSDQGKLLEISAHRDLIDAFTGDSDIVRGVAGSWQALSAARLELDDLVTRSENAASESAFLRHQVEELEELAPVAGEADQLSDRRSYLMNVGRIAEALDEATAIFERETDVASQVRAALGALSRVSDNADSLLDDAIAALERSAIELDEAQSALAEAGSRLDSDDNDLQRIDERLFALRDLARKHRVEIDALPDLVGDLRNRLDSLEDVDARIDELRARVEAARQDYRQAALKLGKARVKAAKRLDTEIARELPPLRMPDARFRAFVETLDEEAWGPTGMDRVSFLISTNPGSPEAPIGRVASGGELSRLMLALKVALANAGGTATMIFDEIDAGVGGATAAAVGERLSRLSEDAQVLVVTHSPQIAARGAAHFRVEKQVLGPDRTATSVVRLDSGERRDEIARMLAGASVTEEARAAADRLLRPAAE